MSSPDPLQPEEEYGANNLEDRVRAAVMEYHRENSECAYDPDVLVESIMYEINLNKA
jgi:hypothetical protein